MSVGDADPMGDGFLRLDHFEDVVVSLKLLRTVLPLCGNDPSYWKWAILAAHSALQGACVCILTQTDGTGALDERSTKATREMLYGETEGHRNMDNDAISWPKPRVANLSDLLKRLPDGLDVKLPGRNATRYPFDVAGDLRRLHELRNEFTHFSPKGWSIELAGLPRIIRCAIESVDQISTAKGYGRRNRFPETDISAVLDDIGVELDLLADSKP